MKKNTKKIIAMVLMASLLIGLTACSNSSNSSKGSTATDGTGEKTSYDKVAYAYATFNNIPETNVIRTVEEEINKITREKIGVEVELMPINIAEYSSTVSLSLQGGDKIDLFQTLGNLNACISSEMAYDITDIIDSCAKETKEIIGDDFLSTGMSNGKLYAIPMYKPYALTPMVIYRQDIADELGIDMTKVTGISELTEVLRKVKAAYPDMTPFIPSQTGISGIIQTIPNLDFLTDDFFSPKGVLMGEDMTVVDLFATEEFANACNLVREWYNDGLILKDSATTTSTASELMSSGNSFCYIASYSYPTEDTANSLKAQSGNVDLGAIQIGDAYLDTTSINAVSWMVSSTSKVPEAALKFLNLTYSDEDIINLLIYGIEGRDYVKNADGLVSYPEGEDASTVPYTAQLSCGTLGNFFKMYTMVGSNPDSLEWELEQNKNATKSPAMGFSFDSSSVKTEYTAVSNVINQYLPALQCGSIDPEKAIPEFVEKLKSAGFNKIIEAKQQQLDSWLANNQ